MSQVSYTELRQNLARYMDEAVESRAPVLVTRQGGKGNVVLMSEEEFEGWQETVHLLHSPVNAQRLLRSVEAAEAGATNDHELVVGKTSAKASGSISPRMDGATIGIGLKMIGTCLGESTP